MSHRFSPAAKSYLEVHAVDLDLAWELGVRSDLDALTFPYATARGETFKRRREPGGIVKQPKGVPLIVWFPAGRPEPGANVLLCEGEGDALAAVSALNGAAITVAAIPGTTIPVERITAELAGASIVYLALDGDEPGRKATDKIARALQGFTTLKLIRLGDGEDIASRLYAEEDRTAWLTGVIEGARDVPKLKLALETGGYRTKGADRKRELLAKGIDPDKLDLSELLDEVWSYITDYVILPSEAVADTLALWTVHTHVFDACFATPYLRLTSAAPESAKSLLMEVLASISRRSWLAVNPSPAVLYRKIDIAAPTLLLDEMDNFALDERRDVLAVLNTGYKPGAKVPRCNDRGELEEFACFCAKAYAGLDERALPATLLSRSITIRMETKRSDDQVSMWLAPDVADRVADLRDRLDAWAARHVDEVRDHRPDLLGLVNRRAEVWWILLSLGELAGDEWTERARSAARQLGTGGDATDAPSTQTMLLADIRGAFGQELTIFTEDLIATLNALDESPWGARRRGDGLDARGLARALRPFKIRPKTVRVDGETKKGYRADQFEDAFARYLPTSVTSGTSVTNEPQSQADVTDVTDVTAPQGVLDEEPTPTQPKGEDDD